MQSLGREAGRPCYQMNGHQMTYEASFESPLVKKLNTKLNINNKSDVNSSAAFGNIKMSTIKRSETAKGNA